jgi:hypothetical protein
VELQHIDFGEGDLSAHAGERIGSGQTSSWQQTTNMTASAEGTVLSALIFIPDESPSRDLYGKVGAALLDESFSVIASDQLTPGCELPTGCTFRNHHDQIDSAPYVGFGARFKIAPAAGVRIEYEAVMRDGGDPTQLLSVGIAAEF